MHERSFYVRTLNYILKLSAGIRLSVDRRGDYGKLACSTANRQETVITNYLHKGDIPADLVFSGDVAVDTETMGLSPWRDRLCLVQLSGGDGNAHLVQFAKGQYAAPNLKKLLSDPKRVKLYHYARFDLMMLKHYLGVVAAPVYCTRTAARLVRTFSDKHGLKELCKELLSVEISKQQQCSDWGAENLTDEQINYASSDVLYLHRLRDVLNSVLAREGRAELAQACFDFLPHRAELDRQGWLDVDIFAHS